ncbi:MAG: Txe/YoeB family addiction module toxin [Eubacterium sp.]|nr:Txe/YoeB family addiction module toxin [Eubacterium sp.]
MVNYKVVFTKQAVKDQKNLKGTPLAAKAKALIEVIKADPFKNPPPYESLRGNLQGFYSRRINYQHRLVYQVYEKEKVVKIVRMWTHYEKNVNFEMNVGDRAF